MNFIDNIASFGHLRGKSSVTPKKASARHNFMQKCISQIEAIHAGSPSTRKDWFKKLEDGTYLVWLKNGIRLLPLIDDSNEMACAGSEEAMGYLLAAHDAAKHGEFDSMFEATKPPVRKSKPKSNVLAACSEKIEPVADATRAEAVIDRVRKLSVSEAIANA